MFTKRCPACGGDIYFEEYWNGETEYVCLQCFQTLNPREVHSVFQDGTTNQVVSIPNPTSDGLGRELQGNNRRRLRA